MCPGSATIDMSINRRKFNEKATATKGTPRSREVDDFLRQDYKIWFGRSVTKRDVAIFGMWKSESTKTGPQSSSERNKMEERGKKRASWLAFLREEFGVCF